MSHVANVEVEVKDLTLLEIACKKLGLTLVRNQNTYEWYGKWMDDWHTKDAAVTNGYDTKDFGKCEHAIKVPNSDYEIGVVKNPNGTGYRLIFDAYDNGSGKQGKAISERLGGMHLPKLKNEYACAVTTQQLNQQGFRVTRTSRAGKIFLKGVQ